MAVLIHNGVLVDGKQSEPMPKGWLFAENGIIQEVGEGKPPEARGARVIDAAGGTILPGLMNLHTHIQRRHLHRPSSGGVTFRLGAPQVEALPDAQRMAWAIRNAWDELREGTTTMRDTGSKNKISNNLKEVFESGILRGPRIVACGEGVAMTGGHGTHRGSGVKEADGPDEVRKAVRAQLKAGADWIKLLASGGLAGMPERDDPRFVELGEDELRAGVEEAHKRRRRVCAHADATESIKNCIRAGVDCIEHGPMLDDEAINMMITHRTYLVPTMSGLYNFMVREQEHGSKELAALLDEVVIGPHRAGVAKAYQAGVRIGTGTDTLGQLVQEIEMLHACGMSPMAAIQAATSVAAEILGLETEIGALEPGKRADAIVVRGNPLEHLGVLHEVAWVIKNGSVVEGSWFWGDAG